MSRKDVQHKDIDPSIESTHGFILLQVHVVSTYRATRIKQYCHRSSSTLERELIVILGCKVHNTKKVNTHYIGSPRKILLDKVSPCLSNSGQCWR